MSRDGELGGEHPEMQDGSLDGFSNHEPQTTGDPTAESDRSREYDEQAGQHIPPSHGEARPWAEDRQGSWSESGSGHWEDRYHGDSGWHRGSWATGSTGTDAKAGARGEDPWGSWWNDPWHVRQHDDRGPDGRDRRQPARESRPEPDSGRYWQAPWADGRDKVSPFDDSAPHGGGLDHKGVVMTSCRRSQDGSHSWAWDGWKHFGDVGGGYRTGGENSSFSERASGPRPSEKLAIPTFAGEGDEDVGTSARSYLRMVEAWRRMTRLPSEQQGLVLYQSLTGKAWVAAEELNVDILGSKEGVPYLISWISSRYLDLEITRIGKAFSEFFRKLRRRPGQSIRDYNSEYDRLYARLREVGCSLPEDCAAWLYVDRLQLDESSELNLLASVGNKYSLGRLQQAAVIQDRGLRKPWESGKPRKPHVAHVTDMFDEGDLDSEGDELLQEGFPEEVATAYVAFQSAKNRYKEQVKSRGFVQNGQDGPDKTKAPRDDKRAAQIKNMKAKSFCAGCHQRGHWHRDPECPNNRQGGPATVKEVDMCTMMPQEVFAVRHAGNLLLGIADTACARTVAGTQWLQDYSNYLAKLGAEPQLHKECEAYRFGTGRIYYSTFYVILSFELGGKIIQVRTSIINGDIPLLLSKAVLGKLGMIYDVENGRASFTKIGVQDYAMLATPSGHPAIAIVPAVPPGGSFSDLQIEDLRFQARGEYTVFALAHHSLRTSHNPSFYNLFHDKKLDPGIKNMLVHGRFDHSLFMTWWEKTSISGDFWVEGEDTWVRVHCTPRRAFFNPSTWRTSSTVLKDMLLACTAEIRTTEGVCCSSGRYIESVVDRWSSGCTSEPSLPLLWIGRSVFPKTKPSFPPTSEPP